MPSTTKVYQNLVFWLDLLREKCKDASPEYQAASRIHRDVVLHQFFKDNGSSDLYINHSVCFCCLMAPPEHSLPCGHLLCTPCLEVYGLAKGKSLIEIRTCPLHGAEHIFNPPWLISIKPPSAGVRILVLDGYANFNSFIYHF